MDFRKSLTSGSKLMTGSLRNTLRVLRCPLPSLRRLLVRICRSRMTKIRRRKDSKSRALSKLKDVTMRCTYT